MQDARDKVSSGNRIILKATDMADSAQAVAKLDSVVYFVDGAVLGDLIEAEVYLVKKNYRVARAEKLIEASPARKIQYRDLIIPPYGLSLLPLEYSSQLEIKTKRLERSLGKSFDAQINPIIALNSEMRYRNKAVFPVRFQSGRIAVGSFERGSHKIVRALDNPAMPETYAKILEIIITWAEANKISAYDENRHRGVLKFVNIRSNSKGEHMLVLVLNEDDIKDIDNLVSELKAAKINLTSLIKSVNPRKSNVAVGGINTCLYGSSNFVMYLDESKFILSPDSFFQVCTEGANLLYQEIVRMADLKSDAVVWDIFCGVGSIGIYLANKLKEQFAINVAGIEVLDSAIKMAEKNVLLNGLRAENFVFEAGKAEDLLPKWTRNRPKPDLVIVDPPRKGVYKKALEAIISTNVEKIIYVSCNPATLARDLIILSEAGYMPLELSPVDMFPMTMHVESVCLLIRTSRKSAVKADKMGISLKLEQATKKR